MTITNLDWVPKKSSDVPPSPTKGYGWKLSADFCRLFNQSEFARRRRRWAVLTNRGDALILCGIRDEDRPLDPAAFPPCVQDGLTYHDAETMAINDNAARFAVARVPRQWTISLRRIDAAAYGDRSEAREGGDA